VFPTGLCVAAPAGQHLFETKSRFCVQIQVHTIDSFKNVQCVAKYHDREWFFFYYKEVDALDLMLRNEVQRHHKILVLTIELASYCTRNTSPCPFPFDCPEGRQLLASKTHICWNFEGFHVRYPEHLFECRYLSLDDARIHSNPLFERKLDRFRGSLALLERESELLMLEIWQSPNLELDELCLYLAFMDDDRVGRVASLLQLACLETIV